VELRVDPFLILGYLLDALGLADVHRELGQDFAFIITGFSVGDGDYPWRRGSLGWRTLVQV